MLRKLRKKMFKLGFVENYRSGKMVLYPSAKINIGLYVCDKRKDGYHNICSLFYPLKLSDILEFIPIFEAGQQSDELTTSGIDIPGEPSENLVLKACSEMRKTGEIPFFKVHLHKIIPLGAGLGGGSSDGAAMLRGTREYLKRELSVNELMELALSLGSDCPFFLSPVSSLARGRGEILQPKKIDLEGYWISVFNPGIHVSTAMAYQKVKIGEPPVPLEYALEQPVESWKDSVENVFEPVVFDLHPEVGHIKNSLYAAGAVFASMSGSGSSVFGIFRERIELAGSLLKYHIWTEQI